MRQENLSLYYEGLFGSQAILTTGASSTKIWGIFDEEHIPMFVGQSEIESRQITFCTATSLIANVSHGDELELGDRVFEIVGIEPTDDGALTNLVLKELN